MYSNSSILIFTDLDGTLLNRDTFKFDSIKTFLKELKRKKLNKPSSRRERVTLNITLMKGKFPNVFFAIFFLSLYIL